MSLNEEKKKKATTPLQTIFHRLRSRNIVNFKYYTAIGNVNAYGNKLLCILIT